MSDYLGNLLKRSFAPVAEVQPRVPSFFEPMSASVLAASPGDSDVEAKAGSSGEVQPGTGERNFQPTPHNTRHTWLGEAAIIHPEDEPREQSPTPFSKTKPALRPLERTAVVSPDRAADKKTEPTVVPRITVIQPRTPVEPPELNHASPVGEPTLLPQAPPTKASRKTPAPEQSSVSAPRATSKVDERNKIRFGKKCARHLLPKLLNFENPNGPCGRKSPAFAQHHRPSRICRRKFRHRLRRRRASTLPSVASKCGPACRRLRPASNVQPLRF